MATPLKKKQDKKFWGEVRKKTMRHARLRSRGARAGKRRTKKG